MLKIDYKYRNSVSFRVYKWLFFDGVDCFKSSLVLRFLDILSKPGISLACLVLAIGVLLYQSVLPAWLIDYKAWFILACLALAFCDKKKIKASRSIWFLLLFIIISLVSSLLVGIGGQPFMVIINGLYLVVIFPLFYIVGTSLSKRQQSHLVSSFLLLSLPLLLAGAWQFFLGDTAPAYWVSQSEDLISNRAFGWSQNPNNLAVLAMITSLLTLFIGWLRKKYWLFWYSFLAGMVLFLTFSRANWLAWCLAVSVFLILKNWRYLGFILLGNLVFLSPRVRQRLMVIFDSDFLRDSLSDGRLWALSSNIDIFKKSPGFGAGPGSYGSDIARDHISPVYGWLSQDGLVSSLMVDMQWPQILAQTGLLGILSVAGYFLSYLTNSFRSYRQNYNPICLASIALLLAMFLIGWLETIWYFAPTASLFGVFLGIGASYNYEK